MRWQKLHSLASFGLSIGSWGLPMYAQCGLASFIFLINNNSTLTDFFL